MGGKNIASKLRSINKGKKPHESVYDPEVLPRGSIIAADVSTLLVPFVKSNEGAAQSNAMPRQSVTCIQDKLEVIYIILYQKKLRRLDINYYVLWMASLASRIKLCDTNVTSWP